MGTKPLAQHSSGPPPSDIQTRARLISLATKEVQPSMRLYMQDEDSLQLAVLGNFNNATVVFQLRFLTPDGQIIPTVKNVISPTAGVYAAGLTIPMGEGVLLSAATGLTSALANGQWVYANITLRRGGLGLGTTHEEILAGYVASGYAPSWPEWPPQRPTDGPGTPVSVTVGNPAAGQEWSVAVPVARRWQVLSAKSVLTASATVANRFSGLVQSDGANQLYIAHSTTAIIAGQVTNIIFAPGIQPFADLQTSILMPLPSPDIVDPGYVISSNTVGLQAGDQHSAIQLMVQEWAEIV